MVGKAKAHTERGGERTVLEVAGDQQEDERRQSVVT